MRRSCTPMLEHTAQNKGIRVYGILERKVRTDDIRPTPRIGNKFERDFWARGYYVSTVGNVDEETVRKYIMEQQEESYKEGRALR